MSLALSWNGGTDAAWGLPPDVDPCGERGEFHTVVTNGPMFTAPLDVVVGETSERDGYVYVDVQLRPVYRR